MTLNSLGLLRGIQPRTFRSTKSVNVIFNGRDKRTCIILVNVVLEVLLKLRNVYKVG